MTNGEKHEFMEKIKFFIKLIFSQDLIKNVAKEIAADRENYILGSPAPSQEHQQEHRQNGQLQES